MLRTAIAIVAAVGLSGCYTGPARVIALQQEGLVRLDTVPGPGYDLTVEIPSVSGALVADAKNPADRRAVALEFVTGRCAAPSIVREDVINTGLRLQTFQVRLLCRPA